MAAHLYWRFNISANDGDTSFLTIAEIEMRATVGGADQCEGGTATASTSEASSPPSNAVDNNASSRWNTATGVLTGWWRYQFPAAVEVLEYTIRAHPTTAGRSPKTWTLEWSDDGSSWTVADTRSNETGWTSNQIRTYAVSASGVTGTLAAAESGADTAALAGDVYVAGSVAAAESGADIASLSGAVRVVGALAATESGSDSAAIAGAVRTQGALAAVETGADTAAVAGVVRTQGVLSATETGSDTALIVGDVASAPIGTLHAVETGSDSASIAASVQVRGSAAITETGADTAIVVGKAFITGTLAASETGSDTAAFIGQFVAPTVSYLTARITLRPVLSARISGDAAVGAHHTLAPCISARHRIS